MAVFNQVAAVGSKVPTEWMANGDPGINFFARPTGRTLALGDSRADVAASNAACDVSSASLSFILDGRKILAKGAEVKKVICSSIVACMALLTGCGSVVHFEKDTPELEAAGFASGCLGWNTETGFAVNECSYRINVIYCFTKAPYKYMNFSGCGNDDTYFQRFTSIYPGNEAPTTTSSAIDSGIHKIDFQEWDIRVGVCRYPRSAKEAPPDEYYCTTGSFIEELQRREQRMANEQTRWERENQALLREKEKKRATIPLFIPIYRPIYC